jgi:hypothetical protein
VRDIPKRLRARVCGKSSSDDDEVEEYAVRADFCSDAVKNSHR